MLILAALAIGALPANAAEVDRAFSNQAQTGGQWTVSRTYAHPDAVIFTPQAVWARDFLKGKADPARATRWSANSSYTSCDGKLAVNTGPWRSADGRSGGFFTTVWERANGGWQWISDGRHTLRRPAAARPVATLKSASCKGRAPGPPLSAPPSSRPGPDGSTPDDFGRGQSGDRTLGWEWRVGQNGTRHFRAYLWDGKKYSVALDQTIGR
jgi:hypothetical protein